MKLLPAAITLALPIFAQQTTLPGDAVQQLLSHPPNAQAQFLAANAGWQTASTQANSILFKDPKSSKQSAVLGSVAHQDSATGAWIANDASLSATSNGWRLDGAAYALFVRQSGATRHVITQTYTDYGTKHASTLNFTTPTLTYSKGFTFGFNQDGLAWNLILSSQGFFQIRSVVSKRIGQATHSFPVTSSETLAVNSLGELAGDAHVGLTRAILIPRYGKPIPCSAWSYSNGLASFTCDDSVLKDNQLPYRIDPQSQVTLTDSGTYNIDSWNDGQGDSGSDNATVNFSLSSLPSTALIGNLGCNFNIVDQNMDGGDNPQCSLNTPAPFGPRSVSGYSVATTVSVLLNVNVTNSDSSYGDSATLNDVQLTVGFTTFSPPPGTYAPNPQIALSTYNGYPISFSASNPVGYSGYTWGTGGTFVSGSASAVGSLTSVTLTLPGATAVTAVSTAYLYGCGPGGCGYSIQNCGVASGAYAIESGVATPTISPAAGTYVSPQTVSISTSTPGATIRYTTNSTDPSETAGTVYTGPFTVGATEMVIAIAYESGWLDSALGWAAYTITGTVATPSISPAAGIYTTAQSVSLSTSTPGAAIRYTTDGSAPSETNGTIYTGPFTVSASQTVKAIAFKSAWADSSVASAAYTITGTVATPSFSPVAGIYTSAQSVSISTSTSGATIRYTTDGTTPSETHGTVYSGAVGIASTQTLNAIAYETNWLDSGVASAAYTITGTVATPSISPAAGIYTTAQSVSLGTSTSGATIRYTTDGSTPSETYGTVYSSPFTVSASATVKAIAYKSTWADSALASAPYTITGTVATPTISPAAGTYTSAQSVTISPSTSGASIRYTTDGTTPSETHGTLYGGAISVGSTQTVNAIAFLANWADSAVASAAYTITGTVAPPSIGPAAGTYTSGQSITLTTTTSGASIRYTVDGTTPSETNGTLYRSSFTLTDTSNTQAAVYTVKAIGYKSAWNDSSVSSSQFTINGTTGAPIFTPTGGIYSASQSVALSSVTSGATIRYTTDGTTPSETHGNVYSSPIPVSAQVTINAIAYESGWLDSTVTAETYYFQNPGGGTGSGGHVGPPPNTPPADSGNGLDPRRVGVRALASYWGDAGENIDTNSANLSFSNSLIKPLGRGGWSLPFSLSYNSQMWRHDSGGDWLLGQDVGYGMGWKLQAGSLTPVWSGTSAIDHYIFTDASGAEYNLTVNTGGVWTSLEGIYISYDSNANKLYNTDGSFWVMGCTSAGTEQDAGTMYPTLAEDTNGNQITINYLPGQGMGTANTSARISSVVDTRITYNFTYALLSPNDDIQHLTSIAGVPGESWLLTYSNASFSSPITGTSFGAADMLATLQQNWAFGGQPPPAAAFSYNSGAELTQYTTPMGGSISWGYRSFTYAGNITLREILTRSMNQGAGGFTNSYGIWRNDSSDAGLTYHFVSVIYDNGAGTEKLYYNSPAFSGSSLIVPLYYQEYQDIPAAAYPTLQKNFGWGQNPAGNVYMSEVLNILYTGASSYTYSTTLQTLDNYGNLTQQQVYDYGASTPTRTYNLSYVTDSNYTSRYIRNRLLSATVTANSIVTPLASNTYDGTSLGALQIAKDQWGTPVTLTQHDAAYDTTVTYRGNVTGSWKMGTSTSYAYDIGGNPYKMQDGDGMTISLATGSGTGGTLPALLTPNSNSNLATSFAYTSSFALSQVTGANGATTGETYDAYGRPAGFTTADGGGANFSYTYAPNTQTATFTTTATCPPATGCPSGSTTMTTGVQWRRLTFDGFGRTIKVETGHDSNVLVNTVDTVYGACGCSPLGKVVKTSMPYGPGETEVWTTYTYDASGRQLTSTAPDSSVTTTSYSGNTVTTTDPAGIWKTNVMDAFGNLSAVNEPDPATGSSSNGPVTNYTYNGANQLTNVSMTRGGITQNRTFVYNGSDLTSETTPEAGTVSYTYDGNHHVTQRIDALNQKTTYSYDAYERLTLVQHYTWGNNPQCFQNCVAQWNEQAQQDVNYYYDTPVAGDYTQTNTWGRLSAVVFHAQGLGGYPQPDFTYEYNYNQAGRVIGNRMLVTQGSSHVDLQGQYAWDNQGRLTSMTYPSGPVMTTQFDAMGRPSSMSETACILTPGYPQCNNSTWTAGVATYGSASQLLTVGSGGITGASYASVSETRTYNNMLQLTHLVSSALGYQPPNTYTGGGVDMQYIYNTGHNNGRVAQTIDNTLGETVNYSYDYLHRLTAAASTNGTWGEAYAYDGFGNLTGKTPTQGYAPAMTGSADSNATGGALSGQWDVEKRPMTQGVTQATPFYVYDPWGRRVWRQWYNSQYGTTNCEAYFYGATGQKLESYSCQYASGSLGATLEGINTYFAGKMLSEKGVFIATDRLGSVRGDSNGVSMSYYPWGEERGQGTADGRTKFAGYYRDMPGQDYANARYYSQLTGSFWSPDPGGTTAYSPNPGWLTTVDFGNPRSWNRYIYGLSDPINKLDPTGAIACDPDDDDGCDPADYDDTNSGGGVFDDCLNGGTSGCVYGSGLTISVNSDCSDTFGSSGCQSQAPTITVSDAFQLGLDAPPMLSSAPDPYGPSDEYAGIGAQCMFSSGGGGPWGNSVRGCLATIYTNMPSGVPYNQTNNAAHMKCYANGFRKTGAINGTFGLGIAVWAGSMCMIGESQITTAPTLGNDGFPIQVPTLPNPRHRGNRQ